jgi:RNA polymerase sigma factor (sigma-70 family)
MDVPDSELLDEFVRLKSDEAFRRIVGRYVNLVHAAAMRQVRDAHLAEDVTQATFIVLARRAAGVRAAHLPGWLLATARFSARDALKKQTRRLHHELEAASMKPNTIQPPGALQTDVAASLDEAMSRLRPRESTAVALRYLQDRPMAEVAAAMGVSGDAAQKIVFRALAKLRGLLANKGIVISSAAALAALLPQPSAHAAPAGLAASVSSASAQSVSIATGVIKMMLWTRIKVVAALAAVVVAASGAGVAVLNLALADDPSASSPSPATQPMAAADNASDVEWPFLSLVGCRIRQTAELKLTSPPAPLEEFQWTAEEYSQVHWTIDPALAAGVAGYTISVSSLNPGSPPSRTNITADRTVDTEGLKAAVQSAGTYSLTLTANGADGVPLASAEAHITVGPLPTTRIMINDIQPEGMIRYKFVSQSMNNSKQTIHGFALNEADVMHMEKLTDDLGRTVRFTAKHEGSKFQYQYTLNRFVPPGQAVLVSETGTAPGLITEADGVFTYAMNHTSVGGAPSRQVELEILPAGATLVSAEPANLPSKLVNGRTQIYMDVKIPPGGSSSIQIRYRLSAAPPM